MIEHDGCQVSALGAHFAEPLDAPCGHCSWCQNEQTATQMDDRGARGIDDALWQQAASLRRSKPEALKSARSLARFLCGVSSPSLARAKMTKEPLFGALAGVPFSEVLERATEHS